MNDYTRFTKVEADEIKAKKVEGALPSITEADVGKTLTAQRVYVPDKTIVPEQTANIAEGDPTYTITDYDPALFVTGATVKVVIGETEFVDTVKAWYDENNDNALVNYYVAEGGEYPVWSLLYFPNGEDLESDPLMVVWYDSADEPPESITISACTAKTEYEWKAVTPSGGGDGYDVDIVCNAEPAFAAYTDLTVVGGSIEAVETKVTEGKTPKARLSFFYTPNAEPYCTICEMSLFNGDYSQLEFSCVQALTASKYTCYVKYDSSYAITGFGYK